MKKLVHAATGALAVGLLIGLSQQVTARESGETTLTSAHTASVNNPLGEQIFLNLLFSQRRDMVDSSITALDENWSDAFIPQLVEVSNYAGTHYAVGEVQRLLERKTGQKDFRDAREWFSWLWNRPELITHDYGEFKASLYEQIDPVFGGYFRDRQATRRIRLDEIRWGGVHQDGIPPLRNPKMLPAKKAKYLEDDNIVFGVVINGDARAYPKRILAWHEMFVDTIGGVDIAGVYCTLCGTLIPYKTSHNGVDHALGTSGFLYRSNKLMYDKATQSLWNTIKGEPVLGPLADKGIKLESLSVVTTTWAEWTRRHPDTTVLSLNTGHNRDYGEGVAYNEYFATDALMFHTPFNDTRLKNKQEIVALRFPGAPNQQLAIDTDFLAKNPIYVDRVGLQKLMVLTDSTGANRVYDPGTIEFVNYDQKDTVIDSLGKRWTVNEEYLLSEDGAKIARLPYHRAFWFGWFATFPETRLVK